LLFFLKYFVAIYNTLKMKDEPLKQRYRELVKELKAYGKKKGTTITNEFIGEALGYERSYFSTLLGDRGKVTEKHIKDLLLHFPTLNGKEKEPEIQQAKEHEQDTPPIWQIVLNLTYIGKRDSDSMNTMAATNQRNTDIIAALVSTLLPNSGLAEKLTASLAGSHTPDDLPAEHFVGGTDALKDALSKQQQAGKEKVKHK
jgi:hypothetical protein